MNVYQKSFKLILAGNKNVPAMINAIVRATLQARSDTQDSALTFRQVHVFHTEQSLQALTVSAAWQEALKHYEISSTSLVHHVAKIEDSNVDRFRDLVEQLRTIVNPLDNAQNYIDLTSGISSLKSILAVFAYVLDIENIYSLEIEFSDDPAIRKKQAGLFYHELVQEGVSIEYRKFPPIREFDTFGKLNYTEVLRHRSIIDELVDSLTSLLPTGLDLEHLRESLLSGINSRLIGEVTKESYSYRHSIFASSAGIEEVANIILTIVNNADLENKTLGQKLTEVRNIFSKNPKYFVNTETLEYLTRLITSIRNDIAHPSSENGYSKELTAIQSRLSSQLAFAFLQFTTKTLSAFLDQNGKLVDIKILEAPIEEEQTVFYFGFDGDSTGDYLDMAFSQSSEDEVRQRSKIVHGAISELKKLIYKETKDHNSVLFAEGDNILFKGRYQVSLLNELQRIYKDKTGLTGTIGYGKTLPEVALAMRLSKAKGGDNVMGIALKDSEEARSSGSTAG
ncbi:mCpol domain-containing protein [Coleofasciculus sp.]|uniref:mCpol domain-containing protein n=1 Tax=Coleofasciculus sp. TaxID=3100458 RepID=UPI0039F89C1B